MGPAGSRRRLNAGQRLRHVLWRMHVDRELGAVAGGQIAVAVRRDDLVVDVCARRSRLAREHGQRVRFRPIGGPHAVAASWRDAPEQRAAEGVDGLGGHGRACAVHQRQLLARGGARDIDLLHAATRAELASAAFAAPTPAAEHERQNSGTQRDEQARPPPRNPSRVHRARNSSKFGAPMSQFESAHPVSLLGDERPRKRARPG